MIKIHPFSDWNDVEYIADKLIYILEIGNEKSFTADSG
jgi:hypothetical protein